MEATMDPDPGLLWPKIEKNSSSIGLHKVYPGYRRSLQLTKEVIQHFKTWSVGWPLLGWAGGFFCNLDILYGGLGICKLHFLIKKNFFFSIYFFQFLVIKSPGSGLDPDLYPDPYWPPSRSTGSGSVKYEYGSETLIISEWNSASCITRGWPLRRNLYNVLSISISTWLQCMQGFYQIVD
jgi:hypothetical protein